MLFQNFIQRFVDFKPLELRFYFACKSKNLHLCFFQAELKIPSKNLLIYTQSGVDSSGRRHSVSIPLLPSSNAKSDTTILSIQRKGSVRKKKMESIQEKSGVDSSEAFPMETTKDNGAMDSLTVPEINGNKKRRRKMSPRQNSLPARKSERMSEAPNPPTGSDSSLRGSPRRSSKQGINKLK